MSNSTFAKPIGSECFQKGCGPEPFFIFKFGSEPIFFLPGVLFFFLGAFSDASELGPGIKKFPGGRFFENFVKYPIGYFAITFVTKNNFFFIKKNFNKLFIKEKVPKKKCKLDTGIFFDSYGPPLQCLQGSTGQPSYPIYRATVPL